MRKNSIVAFVSIFVLAALSACGKNPNGPTEPPGPTSVTLRNLVYTRTVVNNPPKQSSKPLAWLFSVENGLGGVVTVECVGLEWNPVNGGGVGSTWTCPQMNDIPVGVVIGMSIADVARGFPGISGTATVCSDVTINGTKIKPTPAGPREYCYIIVDANGVIRQPPGS